LTAPRPLYDVAGWANAYGANDWLGTPGGLLNDDRLGRALDALAGRLEEVASAVALAAIGGFGADAARLHWDFTSVAFCGAYTDQAPGAPRIGFGHSSDHQAHRRQLKVAHATTASGVPLSGRVVDGARDEGDRTNAHHPGPAPRRARRPTHRREHLPRLHRTRLPARPHRQRNPRHPRPPHPRPARRPQRPPHPPNRRSLTS
jgi:hypothetical protein